MDNKDKQGTEIKDDKVIPPIEPVKTAETQEDAEAKIAALETERATLLKEVEKGANYKVAYLKERSKNKEAEEPENFEETDEERVRRITREELASARISQIDSEKEVLYQKTLKENKELKLAQLNKTPIPESTSVHTETQAVRDTMVTPEQEKAFKSKGWTDKDIERYKKNLLRYGTR